jgi:PIN domain nuclease of toxin-antitoxin system
MAGYVVNTHVLVWFLEGNPKLSAACRDILQSAEVTIYVPAMAILEAIDLVQKRRTVMDLVRFEAVLSREQWVQVVPIDRSIAMLTARFSESEDIHDRCVVSTAMSLIEQEKDVVLMTVDENITKSNYVPTLW